MAERTPDWRLDPACSEPGPGDFPPDDDAERYDWPECGRCGGTGEIVTCIDDLCHGSDECMEAHV